MIDPVISARTDRWIEGQLGGTQDFKSEVQTVLWVNVYRILEVAIIVEREGGPHGLLKDMLLNHGLIYTRYQEFILIAQFITNMVELYRRQDAVEKEGTAELLVDILKFGIEDAGSLPGESCDQSPRLTNSTIRITSILSRNAGCNKLQSTSNGTTL